MIQTVARYLLVAMVVFPWIGIPGAAAEPGEGVRRFELEIRDRRVQRDNNVIRVSKGERVELAWTTDERVALHLHGYDMEFEVVPGRATVRAFEAHATGRFPVTSHGFGDEHGSHQTLLYLEVYPD